MSYPSPVQAAAQRARRRTAATTPPMRPDAPAQRKCSCGIVMFYDSEARKWLCPARYDGAAVHSIARLATAGSSL
jgi:hypothetical protein